MNRGGIETQNKKEKSLVIAMMAALVSGCTLPLLASEQTRAVDTYVDYAQVTEVVPLVSRKQITTPRQECELVSVSGFRGNGSERYRHQDQSRYRDEARHSRDSEVIPSLLGGLLGGAIGHQFGGGNGKKAMTVLGALAGASIASGSTRQRSSSNRDYTTRDYSASRHSDRGRSGNRMVERCRIFQDVSEIEQVVGYQVSYEYLGRTFTRTLDEDPGDHIRVEIELEPIVEPAYANLSTSM